MNVLPREKETTGAGRQSKVASRCSEAELSVNFVCRTTSEAL